MEGQRPRLPEPGTVVVKTGEPYFVGGGQGSAIAQHDIIVPHDSMIYEAAQAPQMSSVDRRFLQQPRRGGGVTGFIDNG